MEEVSLPAPVNDGSQQQQPPQIPKENQSAYVKRTIMGLVIIIILAVLALAAVYVYSIIRNHNDNITEKNDLGYVSRQLSQYNQLNKHYPTLAQLNSTTFSAFFPEGLKTSRLEVPGFKDTKFTSAPSKKNYSYVALPKGCDNVKKMCTGYRLTAVLTNGKQYSISS